MDYRRSKFQDTLRKFSMLIYEGEDDREVSADRNIAFCGSRGEERWIGNHLIRYKIYSAVMCDAVLTKSSLPLGKKVEDLLM